MWDENQSPQRGGTGTSEQDAIMITSQSPIADQEKSRRTLFYHVVERGRDGVAVVSNNSRKIVRNTDCLSRLA